MKSKILAVITIAAGLSLAVAGTASAAPFGHTMKHRPAAQVTGVRLQSGLLPASAFGENLRSLYTTSTGKKLWSPYSPGRVSSASCTTFESYSFTPAFGKTAQAQEGFFNMSPAPDFPFTIVGGTQYVNQFASASAAARFYSQALAKFKACVSFTEPNSTPDSTPGGGNLDISTRSVSTTTVGKYRAFWVGQLAAYSEASGNFFNINTLVAVAGTNVYVIYEISGTNDEPSRAVMSRLISQVQKLY